LTFARLAIEPELADRAALRIDKKITMDLSRIDNALNSAIAASDIAGYLRENHRFHTTLYAAYDAHVLADMVQGLWLRAGPSMRVICGRMGTANLPDLHAETLAALSRADPHAAAQAIREDIGQGLAQIRDAATAPD